jgi:hypothetical protein
MKGQGSRSLSIVGSILCRQRFKGSRGKKTGGWREKTIKDGKLNGGKPDLFMKA